MKSILKIAMFFIFVLTSVYANTVSQEECEKKDYEAFIFSGGECINYALFEGDDNKDLIIVVHGTWPEKTNTLGRYAPFAETLNLNTDKTVIAVALPGYSKSSLNTLKSIGSKEYNHQAAKKEYVEFLGTLVSDLKEKYEASRITFVGHSAAGMMGASLAGIKPALLNNGVFVGARFERPDYANETHLLAIDNLDKMSKEANFVLVYGTKDKISKPEVTKNFYKKMKDKNLKVTLVEVKDAVHVDLDMTDPSVEAISALFEEE